MSSIPPVRLGVNIDHVATLRNARGGQYPDILRAAEASIQGGADSITVHLREDRRHIKDADVVLLREKTRVPMNLEMAMTPEMLDIALRVKPHAVCLVPEKRAELTTEGGLDLVNMDLEFSDMVMRLQAAKIQVSAFIDANVMQVSSAKDLGIKVVEFHTGQYAHSKPEQQQEWAAEIARVADHAVKMGVTCHAGHGLNYDNVGLIAAIPQITELNIGHFLMAESMFIGLTGAVRHMRFVMDQARAAKQVAST
ncbi:MAG: pyridoxine 5'-phosphate synthase [Alphaproteobacteria bacterium]|nr:MAG: pyridoxine 5'-phosphate synthase [Alphaproteobacteria bacterium]